MSIIGVPYALLLAFLAFFLSFIPTFGAFITGCACVLLALTQGWTTVGLAIIFLILLQVIENQLSPRLLGKTVGIHPLFALLALVAGAELFGIVGAIFAPITAGLLESFFRASWATWRANHPEEFQIESNKLREEQNNRATPLLQEEEHGTTTR
jgi:predicted PurR-regulated permease PerM